MTIPKNYGELTVLQFQQLERLKKSDESLIDKACIRLSILTGESLEYIESLHPNKIYSMLQDAIWLAEPVDSMPVKNWCILGLKKFKPITEITEYTVAQHKDFSTLMQMNNNDYVECLPEILAICHKELTLNGYKYLSENHHKNVELFKAAKLKDVMGAVFFYSKCSKSFNKIINNFLEVNGKIVSEMMEEIANDKGFQDFLNSGGGTIQ